MTEVLWQFQVHLARCGNFIPRSYVARHKRTRCEERHDRLCALLSCHSESCSGEERAVRSYRITLHDRETQIVVGYFDGSWTTDWRRALDLRKREVAEAHAARMRERCPRNADLI